MFRHRHRFVPVAVEHRRMVFTGVHTIVLVRCRCADMRSDHLQGQWTLEQVRGGEAPEVEPVVVMPDVADVVAHHTEN